MWRFAFTPLLVLTAMASPTFAQRVFVGGGSTAPGDYLRGIGIEAWGAGLYNLNTAHAYAITVDTNIKADKYMSAVFRAERDNYQKLVKQRMEKEKAAYESYKSRVRDNPESLDVFEGKALNAAFEQLNNPAIQEASLRSAPVPIDLDVVRRIPFKLDQRGKTFSIARLTARGKGKWPVAFQPDSFKPSRESYERAIDKAMDQMIDGKMEQSTIKEYELAVQDLRNRLDREYGERNDVELKEARARLREMEVATDLLKISKLQAVMAGIDRYNGKTVDDLRKFMHEHNLKFGAVDDFKEDERRMYVKLYESIDQMRTIVIGVPGGKGR